MLFKRILAILKPILAHWQTDNNRGLEGKAWRLYPLFLLLGAGANAYITILLDAIALQNPYMEIILKLYQ